GTLTTTEGGTVRVGAGGAGVLHIGDNMLGTGTLNIGAAATDAPAAAGVLEAGEVRFGPALRSKTLVFNHTEADYTFAPIVTGTGELLHAAGVTRLTGDSSAFTGGTAVEGGTLLV